jgi:hypothetical protein
MALPKIKHPTFVTKVPSTGEKVTYKPFTVQEEKILLMARESKDTQETLNSVKQIINNCVVTENFDVNKLATFDVEYLILQLRAKSTGETVDVTYTFGDEKIPVTINLEEVKVVFQENHSKKFMITDKIGVVMSYPSLNIAMSDDKEDYFKRIVECIESVYDDENVYDEFTVAEMEEFLLSLPNKSLEKILEFFNTMPKLEHKITIKNSKGEEKEIVLRGLSDFFTF